MPSRLFPDRLPRRTGPPFLFCVVLIGLIGLAGCRSLSASERAVRIFPLAAGASESEQAAKPVFILAFVPLGWQSDRPGFEQEALRQAYFFIEESGIEDYFRVQVHLLDAGPPEISPDTDRLLQQIVQFGRQSVTADRYIGLTDGDLIDERVKDLRGRTLGPDNLVVVVEAGSDRLLAHELGHTFGLCDEYNYSDWSLQDRAYPSGCPNPYPLLCPRLVTQEIICIGQKTADGRFSLMGPSGLDGGYGYNTASSKHLQKQFKQLAQQSLREK